MLGFFVGGSELSAAAKTILAERTVAAAFKKAKDEAIESARISNSFYRDGSALSLPQELATSSGRTIKANPDRTTTVLGTFVDDTNSIINGQLSKPKGTVYDGPPQPGSFNLLNTPDELYKVLGPDGFWKQVNKPFIDAAIQRGDDIALATNPSDWNALNRRLTDGTVIRSGFGKEYDYLVSRGYRYNANTGKMIPPPSVPGGR